MSSTFIKAGSGEFQFDLIEDWGQQRPYTDTAGVAVDSQDQVYILSRDPEKPITVVDTDGRLVRSWGDIVFKRPHAILIAPDDCIYCLDDQGHSVRRYSPDGKLLLEINTADKPANTGYIPGDLESVLRSGPPFNTPTGMAVTREGNLLVSDGYGNARIHRFNFDGHLLSSFGEPGHGPGQFFLPHAVAVDRDNRIYVADRENSRVQVFEADGAFVSEWRAPRASSLLIDAQSHVYVAEMGEVMQGPYGKKHVVPQNARPRITVRNTSGEVLAELLPSDPEGNGLFFSPHSIALDSKGNLYVSEVSDSFTGGLAPKNRPRIHKYVRL